MSERRARPWQWGGGILLEQHKDPILSQELVQFIQPAFIPLALMARMTLPTSSAASRWKVTPLAPAFASSEETVLSFTVNKEVLL